LARRTATPVGRAPWMARVNPDVMLSKYSVKTAISAVFAFIAPCRMRTCCSTKTPGAFLNVFACEDGPKGEAQEAPSNPDGCAINDKTAITAVFAFIALCRMRTCCSTPICLEQTGTAQPARRASIRMIRVKRRERFYTSLLAHTARRARRRKRRIILIGAQFKSNT